MQISLSSEEGNLLIRHLTRQAELLDAELVHTDKRELQRALAQDVRALRALLEHVRASANGADVPFPDLV